MKSRFVIFSILITALMLSCSLPFFATSPQAPSAPATLPPAAAAPTDTVAAAPADTAAPAPTDTPSAPAVTPIKDPVNCRFGPGTVYESQGSGLAPGVSAPITGKTTDGSWWQIDDPSSPGQKCWVGASVTTATGDLSGILVVPPPAPFVTDLTITVKPTSISVGGCMGPIPPSSIKGTISVNGPTTVKWYFETQQGGPQTTHSLNFTKYGMQNVSGSFSPSLSEGTYWVHLVITAPNSMFEEATYKIKC